VSGFDEAFPIVMDTEKGFVNNPKDPGGATKWGVTERVARKNGYTGDMRNLLLSEARDIAKKEYWDPHRCDELPYIIAFQVFDTAYNGGYAVKWLQLACNVKPSGIMNEETITAANGHGTQAIVMVFCAHRLMYYTALKGLWKEFGRGWATRIAHNMLLGAK